MKKKEEKGERLGGIEWRRRGGEEEERWGLINARSHAPENTGGRKEEGRGREEGGGKK